MTGTCGVLKVAILLGLGVASILPEDLREVAGELGCGEIQGFYDRPGMVEPPFLYGYFPGPKEDSALFWCQEATSGEFRFVSVRAGSSVNSFLWRNYPGGLSVAGRETWDLAEFRYVDAPDEPGPMEETSRPPVQSEYDGVITLLYPLGDRWLFRILH